MLHFESDYTQGAHEEVMRRLCETNMEATSGYGTDEHCARAADMIRDICKAPDAKVYFLVGGTQTNDTFLDGVLRSWQGVVSADTGHINQHEAGAVEHSGHKVLSIPGAEGKMDAETLREYLKSYHANDSCEHMVYPGAVYISFPTEYGTIYSKAELTAIYGICREYKIPLFVDGARLGYGLACKKCDVTIDELAHLCDAFYIGGTKVGALFGEALVITDPGIVDRFISVMKQHGALLAKGRLLGVQFEALLEGGLYFHISENADNMADLMKDILLKKGYKLFLDSPTNQVFVLLEDKDYKRLSENVVMSFWEKPDENHTVVRLAASWATAEEDVRRLEAYL